MVSGEKGGALATALALHVQTHVHKHTRTQAHLLCSLPAVATTSRQAIPEGPPSEQARLTHGYSFLSPSPY